MMDWIKQFRLVTGKTHYMDEDSFTALFGLNFAACTKVAELSFHAESPIQKWLFFFVALYHLRVYPVVRVGALFWDISPHTYEKYVHICINWWHQVLPKVVLWHVLNHSGSNS